MKGDRSTFIAAGIGGAAVLSLGAVTLNASHDESRRLSRLSHIYRETSRDHGVAQAKREMTHIYEGLIKFAHRTRRLPAGDPLDPSSEFRREITLTEDDVRPPVEWGQGPYWPRYLDQRGDGTSKPAFPPKGVRDVWMSCAMDGPDPSIILLWSDGKIETRPGNRRLVVRLPSSPAAFLNFYNPVLLYPDEPGTPLIFQTVEQRQKLRSSMLPLQFRVGPFRPPPVMFVASEASATGARMLRAPRGMK